MGKHNYNSTSRLVRKSEALKQIRQAQQEALTDPKTKPKPGQDPKKGHNDQDGHEQTLFDWREALILLTMVSCGVGILAGPPLPALKTSACWTGFVLALVSILHFCIAQRSVAKQRTQSVRRGLF